MKIVGHRGARGLAPENTLAGLKKGLEYPVEEVEMDLRVTKDNVVVLHHDRSLKDPQGKKFRLSKTTFIELRQHKPDLTTLAEVTAQLDKSRVLYLEVKPREKIEPIVSELKKAVSAGWATSNLKLTSKSQKTLLALHRALPELPTQVSNAWSGVIAQLRANQLGTKKITMNHHFLWWGFIAAISRRYELYCYTLNDPKKARRWEKYGLKAVITDYPDRFLSKR